MSNTKISFLYKIYIQMGISTVYIRNYLLLQMVYGDMNIFYAERNKPVYVMGYYRFSGQLKHGFWGIVSIGF